MNPEIAKAASLHARRAIVDDLPQLVALWKLENLPSGELERRFTEFQVVADKTGQVLAAVGLEVLGSHGVMHGEAMARPEIADELREMLWGRVQIVARNHNIDRIWTRVSYSFWRSIGFRVATPEELEMLPEPLPDRQRGWNILFLRDSSASSEAIEKQFAMLRALNAGDAQKLQNRVATFKKVAIGMTVVVTLLVLAWALVIFKYGPKLMQRGGQ
jgi:hypothetical protein